MYYIYLRLYRIAGDFRGVQFAQIVDLYHFTGLIFADVHTHAHHVLYNEAYFAGLIFAVRRSSVKNAKIGPLENFPLYSRSAWHCIAAQLATTTLYQYRGSRTLR